MSFLEALLNAFGNIFQEYSLMSANWKQLSTKLNVLWVIVTMLLSMSFVGNLKSTLMRKDFESVAKTKEEVVDKDMKILMSKGMEPLLEGFSVESDIDKRILCQIRKTNGFFELG